MTWKIGIFGLFGQQNWGNECTLQAILLNIRNHIPDSEIYCICTKPEDTVARYNIPAYKISSDIHGYNKRVQVGLKRWLNKLIYNLHSEIRHWFRVYKILNNTNVIIFPGTGLLTDFERVIYGRCYEILKWTIVSKICRCKILYLSIGAGPIRHPLSRFFIRLSLSLANYRSYRNDYSKKFLKKIGVDVSKDMIYPDLAFSLPREIFNRNNNSYNQVIGVGIIDYNDKYSKNKSDSDIYKKYLDNICTFLIWLLENKYTVRLLVGDTLYDDRVKKDLKYQLKKQIGNRYDEYILDDPVNSVEQLIIQLSSTHIVISPRLHNLILSLMLNKPIISLSYHEKINSLMRDFNLEEYNQDIDDLSVDKLIHQFVKLVDNKEDIIKNIEEKVEERARLLDLQYCNIFKDSAILS